MCCVCVCVCMNYSLISLHAIQTLLQHDALIHCCSHMSNHMHRITAGQPNSLKPSIYDPLCVLKHAARAAGQPDSLMPFNHDHVCVLLLAARAAAAGPDSLMPWGAEDAAPRPRRQLPRMHKMPPPPTPRGPKV